MKKVPRIHFVLFFVTLLAMLVSGLPENVNLLEEPWRIYEGFPFAFSLMIILMAHEFSHYFTSRKHKTEASFPYFLPAPPIISPIGTFGAFIKMKSPIITRKALIDIGASGPIAGFVLSVMASVIGLHHSTVVPLSQVRGFNINCGDSLLFGVLSGIVIGKVPNAYQIVLHPVAFAGWIGLFITSLNLIPIGQLDGGHISYAFFGRHHASLSRILVVLLFLMGLIGFLQVMPTTLFAPIHGAVLVAKSMPNFWVGWALWGGLLLILGLKHPPVIYWEVPLDRKRRFAGILALIIFIATFMPAPFTILE